MKKYFDSLPDDTRICLRFVWILLSSLLGGAFWISGEDHIIITYIILILFGIVLLGGNYLLWNKHDSYTGDHY